MDNKTTVEVKVDFIWDDEAEVWIATSDDVPGLVLESESFDILVNRVKAAIPELLELNGLPRATRLDLRAERKEMVYA